MIINNLQIYNPMHRNLLTGFATWMEGFDSVMRSKFAMKASDFAEIGDQTFMKPIKLDGIDYPGGSTFGVSVNKDGSVYKLIDKNFPDPSDRTMSDHPAHSNPSEQAGREFTITKEEWEKLLSPAPAAGGAGGMPGAPMGGGLPGLGM